MFLLLIALNLLLNLSDPINDGYGNASLAQPTDIIYRSVNAIDIVDFEIQNNLKLSFSISFSDLNKAPNLKNGFSLAIIEVYFEDKSNSERGNQLLPGSGMRLADSESWHYAFQITGDYVKVFENTASGINDISLEHLVELSIDGNTINIISDIPKKRNLQAYLMAGNYTPFNSTGWKGISNYPKPWSYSSLEQSRPVVDLFAENIDLQKQAINSGILSTVEANKDSRNLWRWLMIWGLVLAIIGFLAKFLAKTKVDAANSNATNLAGRARTVTAAKNKTNIETEPIESTLLKELDIDIKEYEKTIDFEEVSDDELEFKIDRDALEQESVINHKTAENSNLKVLAPLPEDKLEFDLKDANENSQNINKKNKLEPKKKDKLKVYNLSDDNKNQKPNKRHKHRKNKKNKKNDSKKPLRVIPIEAAKNNVQNNGQTSTIENKTKENIDNSNPHYSLGDSFWDNFDNAQDVSWKPKK